MGTDQNDNPARLVAIALLAIWTIPPVRAFVNLLSIRQRVALHLVRFVGIVFVVLYTLGRFPFSFGLLGGMGDIAVATGALGLLGLAGSRGPAGSREWTLAWNTLGLVDILGVVPTALKEGLHDTSMMAPLREFPLSLLPTFFVPLIIVSHFLIFVRLRRRRAD